MKIPEFLISLLPTFSKDRIVEDCTLTRAEIVEITQPMYAIAAPDFKNHKFQSEHMKTILGHFDRSFTSGSENFITKIEKGFKVMLANLDETKKIVEATYAEDAAGVGLTYLKANLLQIVEVIGFVSKYAKRLLLYTYSAETEQFEGSGTVFTDSITPSEIEWLKVNVMAFTRAFTIATTPTSEFQRALSQVPDLVVKQESAEAMNATLGEKKLDPLGLKFISVWLNPIYHVKMFVAEWQTDRYHEAKAEYSLLQLHSLHLKMLKEKKPDAGLKKQIEYTENRVQKLRFKIAEMEKGNG